MSPATAAALTSVRPLRSSRAVLTVSVAPSAMYRGPATRMLAPSANTSVVSAWTNSAAAVVSDATVTVPPDRLTPTLAPPDTDPPSAGVSAAVIASSDHDAMTDVAVSWTFVKNAM